MEQYSEKYSRVSFTKNICKGISKIYPTNNDVIYTYVSNMSVYICAYTHMHFAYWRQWDCVNLCSYHEPVNKQVRLCIYACTFNKFG